jgi:hypothetical protein
VATLRISISIEETYNRSYHKGRPEIAAVNSMIVINNFISFHFISLNRFQSALSLTDNLKDALDTGLIRQSHIESGSLILIFVRKDDGSLPMCIDYRGLDEVTHKDVYPFPRVNDTLDELMDANFYTHIDLAHGF